MLIDTGAALSLLPYSDTIVSTLRETAATLTSTSDDPIKTYGEVNVVLGFRVLVANSRGQWSSPTLRNLSLELTFLVKTNSY